MITTRILVVDDFQPWRLKIRSILERNPFFQVVGEASDGAEGVRKASHLRPNIVLLDIGMPVLNGIEAARMIRQTCPESRIIFLTQEDDSDLRRVALDTGAAAYLLKSTGIGELLPAIETAMPRPKLEFPQPVHPLQEPAVLSQAD
jgi:DNA-binding NarL/FixJ family response regulator